MNKNVLILGAGAREHALAWKLAQSPQLNQLFAMPGNPGIKQFALLIPGDPSDAGSVIKAVEQFQIDVVLCGPEAPLDAGIMDALQSVGWTSPPWQIGPTRRGAQLESSKAFSKAFMSRHAIPTAAYGVFTKREINQAMEFISQLLPPIVIKASGLAAGKGVVICDDHHQAELEIIQMFSGKFGSASETLVIEEFLKGIEFSVFILTNGTQYVLLPEAKDYKRIGIGDTGPNTGGMGAISPVPWASPELMQRVRHDIIEPTLKGLSEEGIAYQGFIFFGLMVVDQQPFVIEYNCRMGDPETEAVIPRLKTDLMEIFEAMENNTLDQMQLDIEERSAATVVVASGGYPDSFQKGFEMTVPETLPSGTLIFHAGTKEEHHQLLTHGGRVLAITAMDLDPRKAINSSMEMAERIQFENKYIRKDIGRDLYPEPVN